MKGDRKTLTGRVVSHPKCSRGTWRIELEVPTAPVIPENELVTPEMPETIIVIVVVAEDLSARCCSHLERDDFVQATGAYGEQLILMSSGGEIRRTLTGATVRPCECPEDWGLGAADDPPPPRP